MKASEIVLDTVKEYCRVDTNDDDTTLTIVLTAAKEYIKGYTGLTELEIDEHDDITIAVLVLCSDMYDNRQMTVKNGEENRIVSTILSMYSKNYI